MTARESLDDKLSALRALRGQTLTAEQRVEIKKRIGDRSNLVVAIAAAIAGENSIGELAPDLEAAFDRFLINPLKDDRLCRAKLAVVQALDRMEHPRAELFLKAARHIQLEPVWGGTEDSAPPLRAAALIALGRIEGSGCLPILVDAMVDPAKDVRVAAAVALGAVGTESAGLILRLKVRLGDGDPDVLSECLSALLAIDPKENFPLVIEFLEPSNVSGCEAAALALGKSRLPEALDPLKDCLIRSHFADLRHQILLAIAILRRAAAIDFLLGYLGSESESDAMTCLSVLRIYQDDPRIRDRIAEVVQGRKSSPLASCFEREFG